MSISLPSYTRREMPLLGRGHRIWAIITTGLRREFRRPAALVVIGLGVASTMIGAIVTLLFASIFAPGQALDRSFFYTAAANPGMLFFVTLIAAVIGSGLVADDLNSMAFTMYLSRPITHADYLIAKAVILAPLIAMIAILPVFLSALVAGFLNLVTWNVALEAMAVSIPVGVLLIAFYTSLSLFLSSLTRRKGYAAAGVFALTFGLTVPAEILAMPGAIGNSSILYLSPWEDFLAVARAAFGAPVGSIDWPGALAILLGVTILAAVVTVVRIKAVEVISG